MNLRFRCKANNHYFGTMNRYKPIFSFVLFTLLYLFNVQSLAQTVKYSDPEHDFNGYENIKVIGQDTEGLFLLQSNLSLNSNRERIGFRSRKYQLTYFTKDLVALWTNKIAPPDKSMKIEHVEFIKNKVLNVYSNLINRDLVITLNWINTNEPNITREGKKLTFDLDKSGGYSKTKFILSKDQKLFGFVFTETNSKNDQILHYTVVDSDFNIIKLNQTKIGDKNNKLRLLEIALSNTGDILILSDDYVKKNKSEGNRNKSYTLLTLAVSKNTIGIKTLTVDDKIMVQPSIRIDPVQNKGVLLCLYYDPNLISESGIFYTQINIESNALLNDKKISLNNNLHVKLISSEYDDIRGLSDYTIHEIILRNDGGAVILAEAAYETEYSYYDYFTQSYTRRTEYFYANIFVASINADGTLDWFDVIKKSQYSRDDDGVYSSFVPIITSQEILMMLNTDMNKKNEVVAYGINNAGAEFKKLILASNEHVILLPTAGKQITASSIVIPVLVKKKLALAKFDF